MRINAWTDVDRLVQNRVPEAPSLEYKVALPLGSRTDRVELLKDLTGMGNGGGGTLIYGVAEDPKREGIPMGIQPLTDRGLVGVLEDIARSAIRPPLLMDYLVLDGSGGFLLAVEVLRSPLGPYMVEAYDQRRYFIRMGSRTAPMTEQQIRDAYALSARGREHREDLWEQHSLPLRAETSEPWLTLSALPEEPLVDLFDPTAIWLEKLRFPPEMSAIASIGGFDLAGAETNLKVWADGIYGADSHEDRPPRSVLRIHRDGATGLGVDLPAKLPLVGIARSLNAQVIYLAWIWEKVGLRTAVELQARVEHLAEATVQLDWGQDERRIREPPGVSVPIIGLRREMLPWELARASVRHTLVRDFGDRLHQAFGYSTAILLFRSGWLHGPNGSPLGIGIGGNGVWSQAGERQGYLYDSGRILNSSNEGVAGYFVDGVVLDEGGRAMAGLEMAPGTGLPDDFVVRSFPVDPRLRVGEGYSDAPGPDSQSIELPKPVGEWSEDSLPLRLNPRPP